MGTYTTTINSTTDLVGTINNTGTFLLNVTNGNNVVLRMNSAVTLTGGGTVMMSEGQQRHANPEQCERRGVDQCQQPD